jgi:hypothetical protein
MEDGVYKSENALYFVKDEKVIMKLMGSFYKTTTNFMVGAKRIDDLKPEMKEAFDSTFEKLKNW